jgi:hypothetical protein
MYEDHDARLVATTALQGDWLLDNHRVYDECKALVLKGPGWSFIKQFDRLKDGRNAVLTLRCQHEKIRMLRAAKRNKTTDQSTGRNASSLTTQDGNGGVQETDHKGNGKGKDGKE